MPPEKQAKTNRPGHIYNIEVMCDGELFHGGKVTAATKWAAVFTVVARLMAFMCQTAYEAWNITDGIDPSTLFEGGGPPRQE